MRYVFAGKKDEIPPGGMKVVENIDRVPTCLINLKGQYYAVSGVCAHNGAFLADGQIIGEFIQCPWHKAMFRIKDGKNGWPAPRKLRTFPVKVEKDSLFIGINDNDVEKKRNVKG
jgi:nitrite reductase/ring-hydroxylating ferredoxin subunit